MPFVRKALRPNLRRKGNDPQPADPEQPDEPRPTEPTATTPEPEIQEEKTEDIRQRRHQKLTLLLPVTPSPKVTEVYEEEEDNDKNEPQPKAHEIELSLDETPVRESKASDMRVEIATGEKADLIPSGGEPAFEIDEKTSEEDEAYTGDVTQPYNPRLDLEHYKFPTLDLLNTYNDNERPSTWRNRMPTRTASSRCSAVRHRDQFDQGQCGPTITLYEITPAEGVRISKIRNLEDDIALSLSALGIRIIAPIPGKGTIGIEVPNANPRIVPMSSILASKKFQETTFDLPVALGKTITNEVFMVDLAKAPHMLVAGATGQGKSVGLNAIVTSLLYKKHPSELKFVIIDPKKVEFAIYAPIERHFLAKLPDGEDAIITDVTKVVQTLNSLCVEMDTRYDLLRKAGCRNIKEYNAKFISRQLNPEKGHRFMPYIVIIIDEFGDLIMTAARKWNCRSAVLPSWHVLSVSTPSSLPSDRPPTSSPVPSRPTSRPVWHSV